MEKRHLAQIAFSDDFGRQMRFIAGPRQCGKSFLARRQLESLDMSRLYYTWDDRSIREAYRRDNRFIEHDLGNVAKQDGIHWACFDEIHKMPSWKNILKDFFDHYEERVRFIVTGSAQLDSFRRSGDSLAGRYLLFHLFPFTLRELVRSDLPATPPEDAVDLITPIMDTVRYYPAEMDTLLAFSGFPEPFLSQKAAFQRRWKKDYVDRLIREDLRDITRIVALENVAALMALLPSRIGSPLSINTLSGDMGVNYTSMANYVNALQLAYVTIQLPPWSDRIARSIRKEKKCYFMDWTQVEEPAARFENFLAINLLAWTTLLTDAGIGDFDLWYVRTRDGKESDFLISRDRKPWLLAEAKLSAGPIARHHMTQAEALGDIPFIQIVREEQIAEQRQPKAWQISASRFLGGM
ncbi:MAG TPA: ATP-binding protein [Desulfuromonadales bacterium]|nr:ATP-binding protein [Desulfuromonadales bacterium]